MSVWKPDYIDLDSGAWLASRTRRKLKCPALRGIYWEIIHLLNEAGGRIKFDREDLLDLTLATPEQLETVLAVEHFDVDDDGWLTHEVVLRKVELIRERLGKSARGGQKSGETRRAQSEERKTKGVRSGFEGTSDPLRENDEVGLTDLLTERRTERSSRERARADEPENPKPPQAPEPAPVRPGRPEPAPVGRSGVSPTPEHRASQEKPRLDPESAARASEMETRVERMVRALIVPRHTERSPAWPELRLVDAAAYEQLDDFEKLLFRRAFERIRGFDFTKSAQSHATSDHPSNGTAATVGASP